MASTDRVTAAVFEAHSSSQRYDIPNETRNKVKDSLERVRAIAVVFDVAASISRWILQRSHFRTWDMWGTWAVEGISD